jgi:hypothetical protein
VLLKRESLESERKKDFLIFFIKNSITSDKLAKVMGLISIHFLNLVGGMKSTKISNSRVYI